ncbi:uncharacterized protein LOC127881955 isoform X2 [Dreissena polymorpha]|uniref:uncharacterized protein LOC127881955 isoform X2 n=1 Tax=Dreissena polymorpha TaxID=45954 RepID=UPI0022655B5D|nr:uncharacterized protein LOC127881955 isoform X2 [Dreissena polymorpha]
MNSTTCCACAAKFGKEVEGNPCTICEKVFCTSCCALKSKLEMTASRRGRRSCVCQCLIDTKERMKIIPHEARNAKENHSEQSDSVIQSLKEANKESSDKSSQHKETRDITNAWVTSPLNNHFPRKGSPGILTTSNIENEHFTPISTGKQIAQQSTVRNNNFNGEKGKLASQSNWENKFFASGSTFNTGKFELQSASQNVHMITNKRMHSGSQIEHSTANEATKQRGFLERLDCDDHVARNLIDLAQIDTSRGHQNRRRDWNGLNDEQFNEVETNLFNIDGLDMEAIPAFDDIPLALILSKAFNEKELKIAHEKQRQKIIESFIKKNSFPGRTYHNTDYIGFDDEPLMPNFQKDEHNKQRGTFKSEPVEVDGPAFETENKTVTVEKDISVKCNDNKIVDGSYKVDSHSDMSENNNRLMEADNTENSANQQNLQTLHEDSDKDEVSDTAETNLKSMQRKAISSPVSISVTFTNETQENKNPSKPDISPIRPTSLLRNNQHPKEPNHIVQSIINGKRTNKNERRLPTTFNDLVKRKETKKEEENANNKLALNRPFKIASEAKAFGERSDTFVSEAKAYGEISYTYDDDGDEIPVDDAELPTAMRALHISHGKKSNTLKSNKSMLLVLLTDKTSGASTRVPGSNEAFVQHNRVEQEENKTENPEFVKQAERQVNELSSAYARAFSSLRKMQSSKKIKCNACSSPDCQGDFVQSIQGLIHEARKQGLEVNDVPPDGNCMFTAICDQLQALNDMSYTPRTLREKAVIWLRDNPYCSDDNKTHFQAFMEEHWDSYLQRMIKNGEWGDHVVLRALSNLTGCTIKILNAHGKMCTWTTLEPSEMPDERREVILGLVGENHYTSLRRREVTFNGVDSENDDPPTIETEKLEVSEQDRALVELFFKDHVDCSSRMPMCSLSFLITRLFSIRAVTSEAAEHSFIALQFWMEIANKRAQNYHGLTTMISGCMGYGVYHLDLSYNPENPSTMYRMIDLNIYFVSNLDPSLNRCSLKGHGTLCCVGYTQVCYSNEYLRTSRYKPYNSVVTVSDGGQVCAGILVHWPVWPQEASEWITRVRYEDWPSQELIHDICSKGCHLLPEAHENSVDPDIEWKFCFVDAVTNIFQKAIADNQKYCFLILFGMCFEVFKQLDVFRLDWLINPFLYCCERCPSQFWQSHPASCILFILNDMILCFKSRCLPSYFIPSWNLIENISEEKAQLVMEILGNIRSEPLVVFRQMKEKFFESLEIESVIEKVCEDALNFKSTKLTTLNTLIPCLIDIAKCSVKTYKYSAAFDEINEAFQARLSVATCEDAMSFENFIQGCFNGLNTFESGWFATFADKQLQSQLSRPLIRLVLHDRVMKRIDDILDKDVAGFYASSEVPESWVYQFDKFCCDYASFLVRVNKVSDALPVFYRCHERYQDYLTGKGDSYFSEETMLEVYAGIFALYKRQQQTAMFRKVLKVASSIVNLVNKPGGYGWLAHVYYMLGDENGGDICTSKKEELLRHRSADIDEIHLIYWPTRCVAIINKHENNMCLA